MKKTIITIVCALAIWSSGWISVRIYDDHKQLLSSAKTKSMLVVINEERRKTGADPVYFDERIAQAAENKACDMNEKGYFDHQDPRGQWGWHFLLEENVFYEFAGENLAQDLVAPDVDRDMRSFMQSPTHKAIILDPIYQSVGYASCGVYTVQYFVK